MEQYVGRQVRAILVYGEIITGLLKERIKDSELTDYIVIENQYSVQYIPDEHIKAIVPLKPNFRRMK